LAPATNTEKIGAERLVQKLAAMAARALGDRECGNTALARVPNGREGGLLGMQRLGDRRARDFPIAAEIDGPGRRPDERRTDPEARDRRVREALGRVGGEGEQGGGCGQAAFHRARLPRRL
jgi:hypothetical protein